MMVVVKTRCDRGSNRVHSPGPAGRLAKTCLWRSCTHRCHHCLTRAGTRQTNQPRVSMLTGKPSWSNSSLITSSSLCRPRDSDMREFLVSLGFSAVFRAKASQRGTTTDQDPAEVVSECGRQNVPGERRSPSRLHTRSMATLISVNSAHCGRITKDHGAEAQVFEQPTRALHFHLRAKQHAKQRARIPQRSRISRQHADMGDTCIAQAPPAGHGHRFEGPPHLHTLRQRHGGGFAGRHRFVCVHRNGGTTPPWPLQRRAAPRSARRSAPRRRNCRD